MTDVPRGHPDEREPSGADLRPAGDDWTELERRLAQITVARRELGVRRRIRADGGDEA